MALIDANAHRSSFVYDLLGRNTARIDPLDRRVSYGYDPVGNAIEKVDPRGSRVRMSPMGYEYREVSCLYYQVQLLIWNGRTSPVISTWVPHEELPARYAREPRPAVEGVVFWLVDISQGLAPSRAFQAFPSLEAARQTLRPWQEFLREMPAVDEALRRARQQEEGIPVQAGDDAIQRCMDDIAEGAEERRRRRRGKFDAGGLYYNYRDAIELGGGPAVSTMVYDGHLRTCCSSFSADKPNRTYFFSALELREGKWILPRKAKARRGTCDQLKVADMLFLSWNEMLTRSGMLFMRFPLQGEGVQPPSLPTLPIYWHFIDTNLTDPENRRKLYRELSAKSKELDKKLPENVRQLVSLKKRGQSIGRALQGRIARAIQRATHRRIRADDVHFNNE